MSDYVKTLIAEVKAKHPAEPEFHQAVQEVAESLEFLKDIQSIALQKFQKE